MLHIEIDCKRFPSRTPGADHIALQDFKLNLKSGEFVCLIGPSGCGKTTLLNIINGLDDDFEGTLELTADNTRNRIATMFQTPRLMPWLSVLENVTLVLPNHLEATTRAHELLNAMGLNDVLHAYPNRLSGGMQRRVALARAFAIQPELMLMDEPFVSLDLPVANRLRAMLVDLWRARQTTVLFVTHDLREALALGERIVFLSGSPGRIVLDLPITFPYPRDPEQSLVNELYNQLLQQHPDLLAGLVQTEPAT